MCQHLLSDPSFYTYHFQIDQDIAANIQADGCFYGSVLRLQIAQALEYGERHLL